MSSDNNTQLLSAILVGLCLLLLLCWLNSNKEGLSNKYIPGLKMSKEGYDNRYYPPGLHIRSHYVPGMSSNISGYSYVKHPELEGFDNTPVRSMHELPTSMAPRQVKPKLLLDNNKALRRSDSSIQIDNFNSTKKDLIRGDNQFGHEMIDTSLYRERKNDKSRGSLSVDIMELTDIGDRDQLYGPARGEVTMG